MLPAVVAWLALGLPALLPPDTTEALRAAREAAAYAARDAQRLWGLPLSVPLLVVEPASREAVSVSSDSAGVLAADGSLYRGRLPESHQLANTATVWAGRTWAMVLSPLPADSVERGILLMHEIWHAVQGRVGLPVATPENPHLETAEGRTWLRVEGRALDAALASQGTARRQAIADAWSARYQRRARVAGAARSENQLELTEGLAEYTGIAAVVRPQERAAIARGRLTRLESDGNLMRSFPYATGTAWAILLDELVAGWRTRLLPSSDLAALAAEALAIDTSRAVGNAPFSRYGIAEIRAAEDARFVARIARQDSLRALFVTGPALRLPLAELSLSFDPDGVEALPGAGTVYRPLHLSDHWGVLEADSGGGLIDPEFREARIAGPAAGGVTGAGWRLTLNEGWDVVPAERPGDYIVRKR